MARKNVFRVRKIWFLFIVISVISLRFHSASAQNEVAIGSSTTKSNAILWLNGNGSQGLILPVVTNKSAIATPDRGMIVYDDSDNKVWYRNNTTWVEVSGGGGSNTSLNLAIQGNQLLLRDGTSILSTVNIAGGAPAAGSFMVFQGGSWQSVTGGDVSVTAGALQVTGMRGKPMANLPATSQVLVYDPAANSNNGGWVFQPFVSVGGVTSVSGSLPITVTDPTTTPNISIANAGITNALLADNAVTTAKIQDGSIVGADIAASTITGSNIANTTITSDKLAQSGASDGQVLKWNGANWVPQPDDAGTSLPVLTAGQLITHNGTNTVAVTMSGDAAFSGAGALTIANNAITTVKIANSAVDATKLADNAVTTVKINAGAVDATKLADNAVTTAKINAGAVDNAKLADNAVTSAKIANGTITGADIAATTITSSNIANTTITADKLAQSGANDNQVLQWNGTNWAPATLGASGTVTQVNTGTGLAGGPITGTGTISIAPGGVNTTELADNAVNATKLADNAVTTVKINAGAVDATKLADNAVTTAKINAGAVDNTKLADNAVTSAKIANGTITGADIAATTIAGSNIANTTITADKLAQSGASDGQVLKWNGTSWIPQPDDAGTSLPVLTAGQLITHNGTNTVAVTMSGDAAFSGAGALTIANNAVTTGKIANSAVDATKLADNAVTTVKINAGAVDATKLADNAVTTAKINAGAVDNTKLADNAVTTAKINAGAVDATKLADNAVTTAKINANAVDNTKLADNAVTSAKIQDATITGADIANTTITADKLAQSGATDNQVLQWNGSNWVPGSLSGGWNLAGNAGTDPATNFLGTTDVHDLVFRTNNTEQARIATNGNVGIGSANPQEKLDVNGSLNVSAGSKFKTGGTTIISWTPDNFFTGDDSGTSITTAQFNTTLGDRALNALTSGRANIAIGTNSQLRSTTSIDQISVGVNALVDNVTGTGNTTVGTGSLRSMNASDYNTAIGWHAGISFTSGSFNTYLGETADSGNGLTNATAIGSKAYVTQSNSIVLGSINGVNTATSNTNVGIGTTAPTERLHVVGSIRIEDGNQAAGRVLTSNANGVASWQPAGAGSGWTLTGNAGTADATNFIGTTDNVPFNIRVNNQRSGRIDPVHLNAAYGYQSLQNNTIGIENTAVGSNAMISNTTSGLNTAVGKSALFSMSFANGGAEYYPANTAVGYHSLYTTNPTTSGNGARNTALGYFAGQGNTIGSNNVFVGYQAGVTVTDANKNTTGSNNTFVGYNAGPSSPTQLTNATAVGYEAIVNASNKVRLGNASVTVVEGQVAYTAASDRRLKHNINEIDFGLDFISKLKPVSYQLNDSDGRENWGFIAQDIEELLGTDKAILTIGQDSQRSLGLRYTDLIAPMVKAMQEQQLEIETLKAQLKEKDDKLGSLEGSVSSMKDELENIKQVLGMETSVKTTKKQ